MGFRAAGPDQGRRSGAYQFANFSRQELSAYLLALRIAFIEAHRPRFRFSDPTFSASGEKDFGLGNIT
jgi:hypothetical protein